ncbi:Hypothetical protein PHPALM_1327 [Phytophthora palmivora]|uniref:Uncharacterized protein n=1 Tax=Phytophthora palmivora TaxID=4796 RepID=A0A2P4YSL5_9STRA|nr:Hypothetical protein PHPALM_1327 [Phytophthora palmivora]
MARPFPDCNTIENVWSVMATKMYAHSRQYSMTAQLDDTIQEPWDSIGIAYLLKLVESMPRHCLAKKKTGILTKSLYGFA